MTIGIEDLASTGARFLPCGDTAVAVEFGDRVDRTLNDRVLHLDASIRANPPPGFVESVPTFRSLLIHYDPLATSAAEMILAVKSCLGSGDIPARAARLWRIPVCYEPAHAPDLPFVAEQTGLTPQQVVAMHTGCRYHLYMLGFLPGYPYLGDLPEVLRLSRRATPRQKVPAGSVAIAMAMTAIYPVESPGGWHLIGTTPLSLFALEKTPPALLAPGDQLQFEAIDSRRFHEVQAGIKSGRYAPEACLVAQ